MEKAIREILKYVGLIMYGSATAIILVLFYISKAFNLDTPPIRDYIFQAIIAVTLNYMGFAIVLIGGTLFFRWAYNKLFR